MKREKDREKARLEAIISSTTDGLIVFDKEDRITHINPAAEKLLGIEKQKVLNQTIPMSSLLNKNPKINREPLVDCWDVLDCEESECPVFQVKEARCWTFPQTRCFGRIQRNLKERYELCKDCKVFQLNLEIVEETGMPSTEEAFIKSSGKTLKIITDPVLDDEGNFLGYMKTLQDISLEKEVDRMKTEFISTVSHELRTPLTSIKGYVDLIIDGEAGEINEVQREFLEIVKQNNDRLVSLINDLLDVSRIESGRVKLKKESLILREVVEQAVTSIENLAKSKEMHISLSIPSELPKVFADRSRIVQIIVNLLSNAIKYTPAKGCIRITARASDSKVATSISDTGVGIPTEHLDRLFVKFYRVDSSLTTEVGGTGLGLAIVKSIVDLHGGEVWAVSKVGKGSTFTFTLPVEPKKEVKKLPGAEEITLHEGDKILIVDDEPDIVKLIQILLSKEGFNTICALNGPDALKLAQKENPDLITLDIMMEEMNGFEVLRALKEDPTTKGIPVVMLSIVADEYKCLRVGASSFLSKPIEPKKLISVINSLLDRKGPKGNILIAIDDRDLAHMISGVLKEKGLDALKAREIEETLKLAQNKKPELIILDLDVSHTEILKLIKNLKRSKKTKNIPIIALTGERIEEAFSRAIQPGKEEVKTFSPDILMRKIEELLKGTHNIDA